MDKLKDLSYQEFLLGFIATVFLVIKIGLYGFPLSIICGVLWMLGGTFKKAIRREGVPILCGLTTYFILHNNWCLLAIPLGILVLHQGDGFPDYRPTTKDDGSPLGRFVEKFIPNMEIGGLVTKLLIVFLFQVALLPVWLSK